MTATHDDRPARRLVDIEAAAEYLRVSTKTVRRRIAAGDLPAYRIAGTTTIRVDLNEADELLKPITPKEAP